MQASSVAKLPQQGANKVVDACFLVHIKADMSSRGNKFTEVETTIENLRDP